MPTPFTGLPLRTFAANTEGRDFIVGDVHGHFELLEALLQQIRFCPRVDRVFCTGDLIDRGPCSEQVVDWLAHPWFHAVRGNHEQMVLDFATGNGDPARHARNGGAWFYQLAADDQQRIIEALELLPLAIEVSLGDGRAIGIIHAESPGWEERLHWREAVALLGDANPATRQVAYQQALYARSKISRQDPALIEGLELLYVGHSTVDGIVSLGNVVYVDTGCSFADGWLTAVELRTGAVITSGKQQGLPA